MSDKPQMFFSNYWHKLGISIMIWVIFLKINNQADFMATLFFWIGASIYINTNNKKDCNK